MAENRQLALPGPAGRGAAPTLPPAVSAVVGRLSFLQGNTDLIVALGVVVIMALLIVPLPSFLLDFLLALNIGISVLILLVSLYIRTPLEISSFPTVLLVTTLFRLGLNISSTRLILSEATAGDIIEAFGTFVVGGNYVVGIIIFLILVIINFIVIIKGSGRISEVTARFTLDALPGKQMSIDADLNAGFIDEQEARKRREKLNRESEFFGAMDGASKFVKGDAIAGLVITGINILGGILIGVLQMDMPITESMSIYTILTIGDGLVSQIPALLISVAAGLVVTRSASGEEIQFELGKQFAGSPKVLYVTSGALFIFGLVPGFPLLPFLVLSASAGAAGYMRTKTEEKEAWETAQTAELALVSEEQKKPEEKPVEELLTIDPLEIELGYGLIPLVDETRGGDLFKRIGNIRRQLATDLGIILPPVRVRDNLQLEPEEYVVKLRNNDIAKNKLYIDMLLAMNPGTAYEEIAGLSVTEPVFGLPAVWIPEGERENAEVMGYTVIEPAAVISTHLTELLRRSADKILDRQQIRQLLENLKKDYPAIVDEAASVPASILQKILQNLLKENIPIRDLALILEALVDYVPVTQNVEVLTEYVRHSLSDTIRRLYQDEKGIVHAIALEPQLEERITRALQNNAQSISPTLGFPNDVLQTLQQSIHQAIDDITMSGYNPVVITAATIRPYFFRMIHTAFPMVSVVSFTELPADTEIEFHASINA